jgi:hypothetical protein
LTYFSNRVGSNNTTIRTDRILYLIIRSVRILKTPKFDSIRFDRTPKSERGERGEHAAPACDEVAAWLKIVTDKQKMIRNLLGSQMGWLLSGWPAPRASTNLSESGTRRLSCDRIDALLLRAYGEEFLSRYRKVQAAGELWYVRFTNAFAFIHSFIHTRFQRSTVETAFMPAWPNFDASCRGAPYRIR